MGVYTLDDEAKQPTGQGKYLMVATVYETPTVCQTNGVYIIKTPLKSPKKGMLHPFLLGRVEIL